MEFLRLIDFDQLITAVGFIAYLVYQNWSLSKELKDEKEYSREVNKLFQSHSVKMVEALRNLQEGAVVTGEALRNLRDVLRDRK